MRVKTLAELSTRDDRIGHFTPLGFTTNRVTTPEGAAYYTQAIVADCDLAEVVPNDVRAYFETCRQLCALGYFGYELFAVAFERAHLAVEFALKRRFLEYYDKNVPLAEVATGRVEVLPVDNYFFLDEALHGRGPNASYRHSRGSARKGWILQGHPDFDASLYALFAWALRTGVLTGRRVAVVADALRELRNLGAHPTSHHVLMPPDAARAIHTASEIINRLWSVETPGGLLSPIEPPPVWLYSLQLVDGRHLVLPNPADALDDVAPEERGGRWMLVEAAHEDGLLFWEPDFETTLFPVTAVAPEGSWDEIVAARDVYRADGRVPQLAPWRDRLFAVRWQGQGTYEGCRSVDQFLRLDPDVRDIPGWGWRLVRADHPIDVCAFLDQRGAVPTNPMDQRARYSIEDLGTFATWEVLARQLALI